MAFDFSYIILICKLYKTDLTNKKKKSKKNKKSSHEIIWSNPEEEIIDKVRKQFKIAIMIDMHLYLNIL